MSGSKAQLLSTESASWVPNKLFGNLLVFWFGDMNPALLKYLLVLHSKSVSLRQIQPICLCRVLERPLRIQRGVSPVASPDIQVVTW